MLTGWQKIDGYWYYFSTAYFDPDHKKVEDIDVLQDVVDADFVMIAYCTPQIYYMSQGFSQRLLMEICCNEEDIEAAQNNLVKEIRNNSVWMDGLVKIAEEYDLPLDTVVKGEAKNATRKHPNLYIPALKDSIPTQRSRRFLIDINRHNEEVIETMDVIKKDPRWYEAVVKQAEERHLSVEENLWLNAIYFSEHRHR